jgi:hypothetical protein
MKKGEIFYQIITSFFGIFSIQMFCLCLLYYLLNDEYLLQLLIGLVSLSLYIVMVFEKCKNTILYKNRVSSTTKFKSRDELYSERADLICIKLKEDDSHSRFILCTRDCGSYSYFDNTKNKKVIVDSSNIEEYCVILQ